MKKAILCGVAALFVVGAHANVIVNGDFETGDLTGWTGSGSSVSADTPLAGDYSLLQAGGWGNLTSAFADQTGDVTLSMDFSYSATGRTLSFLLGGSAANVQLNFSLQDGQLRVYDQGAPGWQVISTDVISANATHTLTVEMTDVGGTPTYSIDVDGTTTVNNLSYFQNGVPTEINRLSLTSVAAGTKIDNISVIPEPATLGLIGLFGGGMLFIRRRFMI